MNIFQRAATRRRGSVLFAALAVVVTISVLGSCLLQLSAAATREQVQSVDTKRAFYMAEAGLAEAWYGIHTGKSGSVGTEAMPAVYGDGLFWVEATDLGGGHTRLVSTGLAGTGRFALSTVIERSTGAVGSLGFFADQDLTVGDGVEIDGYDSNQGPYVPPLPGEPPPGDARLGSNADVHVGGDANSPTVISGDVQPGPLGTVFLEGGASVTGSTNPAGDAVDLPAVEVPDLPSRGDLVVGARGSVNVLPTGEGSYGTIAVPAGQTLTIPGPLTVVVDRFRVDPGATLVIDAALGPVKIYGTGSLYWASGSELSSLHEDPTQLSLQISASEWIDRDNDGVDDPPADIRSSGRIFGSIYAPNSPLTITAGLELFGAVAAQSLRLDDGSRLHFDAALGAAIAAALGQPQVSCWRVIELPQSRLVTLRTDPIQVLGLDSVVLPSPYEAHDKVLFKIRYIDWADVTKTYHGEESKFNWADVKTVVDTAREGDANFNTI